MSTYEKLQAIRAGMDRHVAETRVALSELRAVSVHAGISSLPIGPGALIAYSQKLSVAARYTGQCIVDLTNLLGGPLDEAQADPVEAYTVRELRDHLVTFDQSVREALHRVRSITQYMHKRDQHLQAS